MILTDSRELYLRADWYHDHGHVHNPDIPRALEDHFILGFNYRMNEIQGALGLAQLSKLDTVIGEQRKNKAAIRAALAGVPGIGFREIPDPDGDTATFLAFNLPEASLARKFQKVLAENGVEAVCYRENRWHYVPNWEHFLAQATASSTKYPFTDPCYRGKVVYRREDIPRAEDILGRTLVMSISVRMPKERLDAISLAVEKATKVL
jgi:8-amino-3,8-dideoxy-alpha-D-manno-octulosonate transaminase